MRPEPPAVARHRRSSAAAPSADAKELTGIRVLLVDDDQDARVLLADLLLRRGATVASAANLATAIAATRGFAPDVLVTDVALPDGDGYELVRLVRLLEQSSDACAVKAIALTGYASSSDRARSRAAGFHAHLGKPVEPAALVAVIAAAAAARVSRRRA